MNTSDHIERIQSKLSRLQQAGIQYTYFNQRTTEYTYLLNAPLSGAEIAQFEAEYSIVLPQGYREFLQRVGNGGSGPYYGLCRLDITIRHYLVGEDPDRLRKPFPLTENLLFFKFCSRGESFVEWTSSREDEEYRQFMDDRVRLLCSPLYLQGTVQLAHYGCGIFFFLVVNGEEYGNIWVSDITNEGGYFALRISKDDSGRVDFLTWYEMWLDHNLRELAEDRKLPDNTFWSDYSWLHEWFDHTSKGKGNSKDASTAFV